MSRFKSLMAVVPTFLVTSAVLGATGLMLLLSSPETAVRAALVGPTGQPHAKLTDPSPSFQQGYKPVSDDLAAHASGGATVQPLSLTSMFTIGDRLTISRPDGNLRTLEVVEVRRLGALVNKVADSDTGGNWAMIISRDVEQPNGQQFRFLVQDGASLPFGITRDDARAL